MHLLVSFILVVHLVIQPTAANPVKITVRLEEAPVARSGAAAVEKKEDGEGGEDCIACAQLKQALEQPPSPQEIRQARIQHIKEMILEKLRLSDRPNVTQPIKRLPEPLRQKYGGLFEQNDPIRSEKMEHYYAETKEVISFAEPVNYCDPSNTSVCFSIHLKHSIDPGQIKSAKLYTKNILPGSEFTIHHVTTTLPQPSHSVLIDSLSSASESWINFNVHNTIVNLVQNSVAAILPLKLTCRDCGKNLLRSVQEDLPFLELHTDEGPERNRRRIGRCTGDNLCCKEDLYVSFADIGWDDWIHSPEGYWANYCSGSCANVHDQPAYQHSRVMFGLSSVGQTARARLSPCCSPTKLSQLSLLFQDEDGQVLKKDLPNMAVDACGCA